MLPDPATPNFTIQLFGPPAIRVQGQSLPRLRSQAGLWLLALLVLRHPRPVKRDWLADTLWPDSDPENGRANLRNRLAELRRVLGTEAHRLLTPSGRTLALDLDGAQVDLLAFDAALQSGDSASLSQAVALYRGELMEGCSEEWVLREREARVDGYLSALERLAEEAHAQGRHARAVGYLRRVVAVDVWRESAYRGLMQALAAAANFAEVVQVYRQLRVQLRQELNADPDPATTALYERLRQEMRQRGRSAPPDLPAHGSTNLPVSLTSFVGREQERAEVRGLLVSVRLLTLTGSGGCGKTRLALAVGAEVLTEYAAGVWLVELAGLADPGLVVSAVAVALGVTEQPGQPLQQTLIDSLHPKSLLLILDNCEHMLDACARLSDALLRYCPQVKLLATSRVVLGIGAEQTYRVPSLSVPSPATYSIPDLMLQTEAVRLFVERALSVQPRFALTVSNAPDLAQVCVRLDGIPLAIELAAARVRSLSVGEINTRLDNRFRLLTGGDRTALPRHQTLRALIDWSYDLLAEPERLLLSRLSVFAGGWTLEAAEAVCGKDEGGRMKDERGGIPSSLSFDMLDLLTSLADKSLVVAEVQAERTRYRMLETVRLYARDRLLESGESDAVRTRHRDWVLALVEEAEPKLSSAEQGEWLQRLEAEHENLRAGLDWSLSEAGSRKSLRLCGALNQFWSTRGHLSEGREWLERALGKAGGQERSQERAKALNGAGNLAYHQGDYASARAYYEESLDFFQETGDRRGIAISRNNLGLVSSAQGDYASARAYYEESLAFSREIGDQGGMADSLNNLGSVSSAQGDYDSAWAYQQESLSIRRAIGDRKGIASCLQAVGGIAADTGKMEQAAVLWGAATAIRQSLGAPLPLNERVPFDAQVATARSALGEDAFTTAWEEGCSMSWEQAVMYALGETPSTL